MTRMEAARRRVRIARYTIGIGAATLFGALAFVARAAHPGAHATNTSVATTGEATDDDQSFFFSGDSSGVGPAGSAQPTIRSGGS